ncbi:MAG: glutathionylspermidine synthase family protein [Ketobacteraceae bacterium]|nr:glutathionylspermidine synthase family protein [Ketobacteraceae bacterium]
MIRHSCRERPDWKQKAEEYGFYFHTLQGEPYWCESGYYQFSLRQIETHLEAATEELHQMCLEVVDHVVDREDCLEQFCIPQSQWDRIRRSWKEKEPSLYGRMDFVYDGSRAPKLLEYNADTPTSVYETGFWQWLWLEDQVNSGYLSRSVDQFNSLQEQLIEQFQRIKSYYTTEKIHFACCTESIEDRGTITYLEDCARQAGLVTCQLDIGDIGATEQRRLTDLEDDAIDLLFKLYPWEMMMREEFADTISASGNHFIEPPWKALLSNKALLPVLWELFPGHPNLLESHFDKPDLTCGLQRFVRKPLFSREGANVDIVVNGEVRESVPGVYGHEGYIVQDYCPLPRFGKHYTLIGSWVAGNSPAGIGIREDATLITRDSSRFLPHIIL